MAYTQGGRKAIKRPLDVRIEDYVEHMMFFIVLYPNALKRQLGNSVHGHPPPKVTGA